MLLFLLEDCNDVPLRGGRKRVRGQGRSGEQLKANVAGQSKTEVIVGKVRTLVRPLESMRVLGRGCLGYRKQVLVRVGLR